MSKKKEDNRDIWDKITDYAPATVGALAGGAIGRGAGKFAGKKFRKADIAEGEMDARKYGLRPGMSKYEADKLIERSGRKWADRSGSYYGAQLGIAGAFAGGVAGEKARQAAKDRRK